MKSKTVLRRARRKKDQAIQKGKKKESTGNVHFQFSTNEGLCLAPGSGTWDSNISMAQTMITCPFNRICSIVQKKR
jgi:hypothetical protein